MHLLDVKLPSTWVPLSAYIQVDEGVTYVIINSSPDMVYAVEGNDEPDETVIGVPLASTNYIIYKKGEQAELYLKNAYTPVQTAGKPMEIKLSNITIQKVG